MARTEYLLDLVGPGRLMYAGDDLPACADRGKYITWGGGMDARQRGYPGSQTADPLRFVDDIYSLRGAADPVPGYPASAIGIGPLGDFPRYGPVVGCRRSAVGHCGRLS